MRAQLAECEKNVNNVIILNFEILKYPLGVKIRLVCPFKSPIT